MTRRFFVQPDDRFGRCIAVKRVESIEGKQRWLFKCEVCGDEGISYVHNARKYGGMSCKCYVAKQNPPRKVNGYNFRHGHARNSAWTPTYISWHSMMQRCYNVNNPNYERYGARYTTVYERWHTFKGFLADMGERPLGMTLDRIDANGDYEPGNCRWADRETQDRNKRVWE